MDSFIGTIMSVGFSFVPRGWMSCNGQLISINQNQALYSVLGTQYGGDGQNTFGLPDLRGRVAVGASVGAAGRINATMGVAGGNAATTISTQGNGTASVTLGVANLPPHNHVATFSASGGTPSTVEIKVSNDAATSEAPLAGGYLATGASGGNSQPMLYAATVDQGTTKLNAATATITGGGGSGSVTIGNTGSGQTLAAPVTVNTIFSAPAVPPFQGVQYIICVEGIYPTRN
ncbi:phage tail protein [Janthinobacterium sp. PC23-8]|uniref:phage tail protein n=1 Tax=Janthinobacterium sp. PC23-8 TaxID=2012679 RepID=UPI000B973BDE|nr:tail fiber protein [Janthinobacterium sp. PC23-8]OYO29002.1 hypothetical protein CD932_17900 [Janthinobacterium sp. PC23-8]